MHIKLVATISTYQKSFNIVLVHTCTSNDGALYFVNNSLSPSVRKVTLVSLYPADKTLPSDTFLKPSDCRISSSEMTLI